MVSSRTLYRFGVDIRATLELDLLALGYRVRRSVSFAKANTVRVIKGEDEEQVVVAIVRGVLDHGGVREETKR